jgi:ATP-dependent RNA helicase DDX56/DBP9
VVLYVLLKLKVIPNKAIIFVNNIDKCYKLKLFLERFGVQSAVLNSELPFNSRYNIIKQFNKRIFEYLIATDETFKDGIKLKIDLVLMLFLEESDSEDEDEQEEEEENKKKTKKSERREYGVSRGVDFKGNI